MVFNSNVFVGFFITFFFLYWFVFNRSLKLQNLLVLAGSYFFYGWWDWHFLLWLITYSLLNYLLGFYIYKSKSQKIKNVLLYMGVFLGVGALLYFKYVNFFITSFITVFTQLHINLNIHTINIALPLGISFYTFRVLSYLFDINKNKIKPVFNWVVFFSYVAFFPCLLSGPIDKAKDLIPQFQKKRDFEYGRIVNAMRQILWGLFKKVVIADNIAQITNNIFDNYQTFKGSTLVIGAIFFSIQLYADFSGYSDMAIGIARLIGFNITRNFEYPFFAQNIADFWRKWHISLTGWLTEYVFTPLSIAFRDYGKMGLIMAIIINFTIIGMWHGANWTFVLFGFLHGCYYIPLILNGTINKKKKWKPNTLLPSVYELINMLKTFTMVSFSFIVFRSNSVTDAFNYIRKIFSFSILSKPQIPLNALLIFVIGFIIIEWLGKEQEYGIEKLGLKWPRILRHAMYYCMIMLIFKYSDLGQQFIYFKF